MELQTESYLAQVERWPKTGRHILAQFDANSIVVYQAYNPEIGRFAAENGYFGGDGFSFNRMSWIKPNFLWMMYRSGWGTKPGQEIVLAIWLKRSGFDSILSEAVHSTFVPGIYETEANWKKSLAQSSVRLQWDPDHHPTGTKLERKAIQLGLRGKVLQDYAREYVIDIQDISVFVRNQHAHVENGQYSGLMTPREEIYPVTDADTIIRLGLSTPA
jgi:hypothetical protein